MRRLCRLGAFAFAWWIGTAHAQPADDADARGKALFDEGKRALEAKDYATACSKLEQSYIVSGVPGALLSWADCEEQRGRFATALALWKQGEAKVVGNEDRRKYVRDRQLAIVSKVSYVEVRFAGEPPANLKVTIDGRATDVTTGPIPVDAGEHHIVAEASGRPPSEERVRVGVGERVTATLFEAKPDAPDAPVSAPPAPGASGDDGSSDPGLPYFVAGGVVGGVGVASLVTFGVTGGLILSACGDLGSCPASERGSVDGLAVANAVTLGIGVAGVATGVVLLVVGATTDPEPSSVRLGCTPSELPALGPARRAPCTPVQVGGFADAGLSLMIDF